MKVHVYSHLRYSIAFNKGLVQDKIMKQIMCKNQLMDNFNKDIDRMNKLISDISHFSKTIAEIEIENFELTNINEFLKENFGEKSTNKKNIKILLQTDNNKNLVLLNKDKFLQVILNLIDNSISIAKNNTNILITSNKKNENCVEIKIYDQGKIPFSCFFQTKRDKPNTKSR